MDADQWFDSAKPRVNGAMLAAEHQRLSASVVTVLGKIQEQQNERMATLETSDRRTITIRFPQPLGEPIQDRFVEINGRVTNGGRELECVNFVIFPEEMTKKFDMDQFNKSVELYQKFVQSDMTTKARAF